MDSVSVIMTCRNEENNIIRVLDSLEKQTLAPSEVVMVDDDSEDDTFKIMKRYSQKNDWTVFHNKKGLNNYHAIKNGLTIASSLLQKDFDFLMILDGDTILEESYIEKILKEFKKNSQIGIAGGALEFEGINRQNIPRHGFVCGSNRIYSKQCWNDVNDGENFKAISFSWDREHSIKAKVRGYLVTRFDNISSFSVRPTTTYASYEDGYSGYLCGESFFKTLIYSILQNDFGFLKGFLAAWKKRETKIDTPDKMKQIQRQKDGEYFHYLIKQLKKKFSIG
jgi:glycosyltransferase involved in cell wall biosynthesis